MMQQQKTLFPAARANPATVARTSLILAVFSGLSMCLYYLDWNGKSAGFLSDDAVYLLMSDGFSPFRSDDSDLIQYVFRQSLFPPLYPLLLAMLGAGSASLLWDHVITTTTLVAALAFFGFWVFLETRDRFAAVGLMILFALLPGTLILSLDLLSEFPYLLLSLLALWLAARKNETRRGLLWIAVCVGLAATTRSAGISLILAMVIWLFPRRVPRPTKWLSIFVAIFPSIVWSVYKSVFIGSKGGYNQFWGWLLSQFRDNPLSEFVPQFVRAQGGGLWHGLIAILDLRPGTVTQVALSILLVAALPTWIQRLNLWRLDAWYLLIGGAMLFLYPFPDFFSRLLLPWVPILLLYAYLGVRSVAGVRANVLGKPALGYAALVAFFLTLLPSLGFLLHRLNESIDPKLTNWKHTRYWFRNDSMEKILSDVQFRQNLIQASRDIGQFVPKGKCVYGVHTAIAMLYGRRIFEQPAPPSVSPSTFEERSQACEYFFLASAPGLIGADPAPAFYPNDRLSVDKVEIVHVWNDESQPNTATAILARRKPSD